MAEYKTLAQDHELAKVSTLKVMIANGFICLKVILKY